MILPGNFGRILALYRMSDVNALFYRERILEEIRQAGFPEKPRRLSSAFCLEAIQEAQYFRDQVAGRLHVIYQVELVDPNCRQHRGDYNKVAPPSSALASLMENAAREYWQGAVIEHAEIVAESALRVVQYVG